MDLLDFDVVSPAPQQPAAAQSNDLLDFVSPTISHQQLKPADDLLDMLSPSISTLPPRDPISVVSPLIHANDAINANNVNDNGINTINANQSPREPEPSSSQTEISNFDPQKPKNQQLAEKQIKTYTKAFQVNNKILLDQFASHQQHTCLLNKLLVQMEDDLSIQLQKHNQLIVEANNLQAQLQVLPVKMVEVKQLLGIIQRLELMLK
ncbi:Hypothetical_protein [Hexamita inflata]|uniref:Hypothetical_protein n=1 Tax=Hexamita inflata TaxID=28002 RepID=A0AA86TSC2_9EUKA|nr:Hypothetical protein HINF_LOCUS14220 [Hexamita inflata]